MAAVARCWDFSAAGKSACSGSRGAVHEVPLTSPVQTSEVESGGEGGRSLPQFPQVQNGPAGVKLR